MVPSNTFACSSKIGKTNDKKTCNTAIKDNECLEGCNHNLTDKQECPGSCGGKSCKCPTLNHNSAIAIFPQIDNNIFYLFANDKAVRHKKSNLLIGFYFIWSPPNIG